MRGSTLAQLLRQARWRSRSGGRSWSHPLAEGGHDSASRTLQPLKMALCRWRTPRRLQERHVVVAKFADRLWAGTLEGVFDRLGLADRDMQSEQRGRDRKGPSVQAKFAEMREQDRAGEDDQGIGEDEIFDLQPASHAERIDADG